MSDRAMYLPRNRLLVHGSCVTRDGSLLLCLGGIGAGKSFFAGRCAASGWKIVADDSTFLVQLDGTRVAAATPEKAARGIPEMTVARIEAIFHLRPGERMALRPLSPKEVVLSLLRSAAEMRFSAANIGDAEAFRFAASLASSLHGAELTNDHSSDPWPVVSGFLESAS